MGIRERILGTSVGFKVFKRVIASDRAMGVFAREYIRAQSGDRVLDVACGLGDMLDVLPDVEYIGVDMNEDYIDTATSVRGRVGARFVCASSDELSQFDLEGFDIALLISAMHHMTNDQVASVLGDVRTGLRPGGRLITVDPVWEPDQATTARVLIALDRGRYVRDVDGYADLLEKSFDDITFEVRDDLLRLPYSYFVSQSVRSA